MGRLIQRHAHAESPLRVGRHAGHPEADARSGRVAADRAAVPTFAPAVSDPWQHSALCS